MSDTIHGTYAGYQRHNLAGQQACEPCRAAATAYMRKYRKLNPEIRQADRFINRTRSRALERLAAEFPARFLELLAEEREQ